MKTLDPEGSFVTAPQPKEKQMHEPSETKLFEMHRRVHLLAVSLKIVLPKHWFVVFDTALDGANPVVLLTMLGFNVTL